LNKKGTKCKKNKKQKNKKTTQIGIEPWAKPGRTTRVTDDPMILGRRRYFEKAPRWPISLPIKLLALSFSENTS
jgi:hypothetical protein